MGSLCCCSVAKSCLTLCDPMVCSTPGFPGLHHLLEFAQTQVHWAVIPSNHLVFCCPLFLLPSSFPASGSFPVTQLFASGDQSIGASVSTLVLQTNAAVKSLQSCPTLCDPIDSSPPGSPVPGILQARTLEWVAISFSNAWKWKVKVKLLSCVRLLATPWTAACQAAPSMGFSRQEYWSGVPLPSLFEWIFRVDFV